MAARSKSARKHKKAGPSAAVLVRAYISAAPPKVRKALKEIRSAIRAVAPGAEEAWSYRIPAFKLNGRMLVWYAGFTNHTSLFPIGAAIRREFATALAGYQTSTGTVRFPLEKPLPQALVKRLVKARVAELPAKGDKRR